MDTQPQFTPPLTSARGEGAPGSQTPRGGLPLNVTHAGHHARARHHLWLVLVASKDRQFQKRGAARARAGSASGHRHSLTYTLAGQRAWVTRTPCPVMRQYALVRSASRGLCAGQRPSQARLHHQTGRGLLHAGHTPSRSARRTLLHHRHNVPVIGFQPGHVLQVGLRWGGGHRPGASRQLLRTTGLPRGRTLNWSDSRSTGSCRTPTVLDKRRNARPERSAGRSERRGMCMFITSGTASHPPSPVCATTPRRSTHTQSRVPQTATAAQT